jgi:hypothetical protein
MEGTLYGYYKNKHKSQIGIFKFISENLQGFSKHICSQEVVCVSADNSEYITTSRVYPRILFHRYPKDVICRHSDGSVSVSKVGNVFAIDVELIGSDLGLLSEHPEVRILVLWTFIFAALRYYAQEKVLGYHDVLPVSAYDDLVSLCPDFQKARDHLVSDLMKEEVVLGKPLYETFRRFDTQIIGFMAMRRFVDLHTTPKACSETAKLLVLKRREYRKSMMKEVLKRIVE